MNKITYLTNKVTNSQALINVLKKALETSTRTYIVTFHDCHETLPSLLGETFKFISVPFNDEEALAKTFAECGKDIAAVIMEPALTRKGLILPQYGFLDSVYELTQENGALLIFDEHITSQYTNGGCQNIFDIEPNFTCWGETTAKDATQHYNTESMTAILTGGLERAAKATGVPVQIPRLGSMFSILFSATPVTDYTSTAACDVERYQKFYTCMAEQGIILPNTQFATNLVSPTHTAEAIQATIDAAANAFAKIAQG